MHKNFMKIAIEQAKLSGKEIPVGALVVKNGEIISKASNKRENDNDVTAHAEILAIKQAAMFINNWRLEDCDLYVTLEPCPMCGWAILQARIKNLYYGSFDNQYGAFSVLHLDKYSQSKINLYGGVCEEDCDKLLNNFFANIRNNSN